MQYVWTFRITNAQNETIRVFENETPVFESHWAAMQYFTNLAVFSGITWRSAPGSTWIGTCVNRSTEQLMLIHLYTVRMLYDSDFKEDDR